METVILAGGSGTRLFPLSREYFPKQFLSIDGTSTFFQSTFIRSLKVVEQNKDSIHIITNDKYRFLIKDQLEEIGFKDFENIILEPVGRNTAPAIALAVKYLTEIKDIKDDELVLVLPSDHIISPDSKFVEYINKGKNIARKGYIVTFGIRPNKPETGYGYIEASQELEDGVFIAEKFHEKPDLETAKRYLLSGNFFWNSGIFLFSIKTIIKAFELLAPEIYSYLKNYSYKELVMYFKDMPDISIDYAVMEKSPNIAVVPMDITWSDIGSWDSVYELLPKDENSNVKIGKNIVEIDTQNSLIYTNDRVISTIGVKDLIIIDTDDVLLIAEKGSSQRVRDIVKILKENENLKEKTKFHTTVYRPWGSYTELETGERYKIKRITVKPGGMLSLQMHYHRSEHWVVIKGTAKVVIEQENGSLKEIFVHENESIFVPKTTKHRLINPGKVPLEIIEVQVGEYVEEDDIVRFDDIYNRTNNK
jgi:mannose-1-phosphate guanylyltransferase/mannose-6-phosphate isomerase